MINDSPTGPATLSILACPERPFFTSAFVNSPDGSNGRQTVQLEALLPIPPSHPAVGFVRTMARCGTHVVTQRNVEID
jgi:hypothetical protein